MVFVCFLLNVQGKLVDSQVNVKAPMELGLQKKVGIRPSYRYEGRFGHFYMGTYRTNAGTIVQTYQRTVFLNPYTVLSGAN